MIPNYEKLQLVSVSSVSLPVAELVPQQDTVNSFSKTL